MKMKSWVLAIMFIVGCPLVSHAISVSWTFQNTVLSDSNTPNQQTVTGGFDYDADTNMYSHISIMNSGAGAPATLWDQVSSGNSSFAFFTNGTPAIGDLFLRLRWSPQLTNGGGTVNLVLNSTAFFVCNNSACTSGSISSNNPADALVSSGTLTSTPAVPEPSTMILFGTGVAGLIGWQYRKKQIK